MALHGINKARGVLFVSINGNPEATLNNDFQTYTTKYFESYNQISKGGFEGLYCRIRI